MRKHDPELIKSNALSPRAIYPRVSMKQLRASKGVITKIDTDLWESGGNRFIERSLIKQRMSRNRRRKGQ